MTRIIAGEFGGRRLATPDSRRTRPTSDRVREALFSRLESWDAMAGVPALDLYAGSGALALEALSRGASQVTVVEAHKATAGLIQRNIDALGAGDRARVRASAALTFVQSAPPPHAFGLVFIDPPYDLPEAELTAVVEALAQPLWLLPDAVVVVERSSRTPQPTWPQGWELLRESRYGETVLWFAEPLASVSSGVPQDITAASQAGGEAAS